MFWNARFILDRQLPGFDFAPMVELPREGETVRLLDRNGEPIHIGTVTKIVWHYGLGHGDSVGIVYVHLCTKRWWHRLIGRPNI